MEERTYFWSVECEANGYADDTFCGTFEECVDYCKEIPAEEFQIVKLAEETMDFAYEIVQGTEID